MSDIAFKQGHQENRCVYFLKSHFRLKDIMSVHLHPVDFCIASVSLQWFVLSQAYLNISISLYTVFIKSFSEPLNSDIIEQ